MEDTFLTLEGESQGIYKEKGSKFLAFAYPVQNEEEVKVKLEDLKNKYPNARHHCYAYMLGKEQLNFRTNDDGEPNHSAGDPILGQIRSNNLTNVLVVVVRYFGGTKLGVGGLINAYKTATAESIATNRIIRDTLKKNIQIEFDYPQMNDVMRLIKSYGVDIKSQSFEGDCKFILSCRESFYTEIMERFGNLNTLKIIK